MREEEWRKQLAAQYGNENSFDFTESPKGGFPDHLLKTTVPGTVFSIIWNNQAIYLNKTYSRAKLLVMGDLTGACNSSHSGKGFISKGAGLAEIREKEILVYRNLKNKTRSSSYIFLYIIDRVHLRSTSFTDETMFLDVYMIGPRLHS